MARRRPRAPHWQRILAAWRRSGLPAAAFCRRRRIPTPSFYFWKRRLTSPTFLPVQVTAPPPAPSPATIELVLRGGRMLRITSDVGAPAIAELVRVLEALPC